MRESSGTSHTQRCSTHHTSPSSPPMKAHSLLKKMKIPFFRIKHFSFSFSTPSLRHPQQPKTLYQFSFSSSSVSQLFWLTGKCPLQRLPASLSTAQGTSRDSHGPPTAQQGNQTSSLHIKNNVPELFDVFLASFKALQQLGARWGARTVSQDPKSIEGIRALPWIGFGSGLLQLRAPPLNWFWDYIHGSLHISYVSFKELHPTSILGNED